MPPKRRDRPDPLQDAKDAINNTTSMNEDDRYQLFATSLLELSNTQTCDLTLECINAGWKTGITLVITSLTVEDIANRFILDYIVSRPNLKEQTKVDILTLFLLKNCSVNTARPATEEDEDRFTVYASEYDYEVIWKNEGNPIAYGEDGNVIHFVQTVIRCGLALVLRRILSKLDVAALKLALVESIGSNSKKCYDILVNDARNKLEEFDLEVHAIFYAACYGRAELLSTLLNDASETALETLKENGMDKDGKFVSLESTTKEQTYSWSSSVMVPPVPSETILERAARRNQPECLKLLIEKELTVSHESHDDLLKYCAHCNFIDCVHLLLKCCSAICSSTLVTILDPLLQHGNNAELCLVIIDKLHHQRDDKSEEADEHNELVKCNEDDAGESVDEKQEKANNGSYLSSIFFECFRKRWFGGLFILASNSASVIRSSNEMRKSAGRTLNALVLGDFGKSATDIIKHLILIPEIDLLPSFEHVVLRSEDIELVEFFLSLNIKTIVDAAQKLKSGVKNEPIKKLLEDSEMKIKVEAVEEAQDGKKNSLKKKK